MTQVGLSRAPTRTPLRVPRYTRMVKVCAVKDGSSRLRRQLRSYRVGGGRGEKTRSSGNDSTLRASRPLANGALKTSAKKNQTGTRKRNSRPSTGCVTATSRASASHKKIASSRGVRMTFICFYDTPSRAVPDRKSTRLNSSHSQISYAVFCLKKKK